VLKSGVSRDPAEVVREAIQMCASESAGRSVQDGDHRQRLPKTRSGKILRGIMQKIADSEDYKMPATIDDPAILTEIHDALKQIGYAQQP